MKQFLSSDLAARRPTFELKSKILRTHKETLVHPIFRWIKEEVEVIDLVQYVEIVVTQDGKSWVIPLSSDTSESEPTNSQTEHSTP
jgi:hypothetical protein